MITEQHSYFTLSWDDSPEAKERIYQLALAWFKGIDLFSCESLAQNDRTYEQVPEILGLLAEEGFRFKKEYDDE